MTSALRAMAVLGALVIAAGCSSSTSGTALPVDTVPPSTATSTATKCTFKPDPGTSSKNVGTPEAQTARPPAAVVLQTSQGDIRFAFSPDLAPCAVHNFVFLATKKYFDDTTCHRLTTTPGLKVLQCGDPTGDGTGGPGYTMQDENPTHLKPSASAAGAVVYPRGAVAMAKTAEPDSAGSQFFLVYGDSEIPPDYAVFGRIDEAGLGILDKVATGGVEPANGPDDGSPKLTVKITKAVIP